MNQNTNMAKAEVWDIPNPYLDAEPMNGWFINSN